MVLQLGDINFQEFGYGIKSMFPLFLINYCIWMQIYIFL